MGTTMLLDAASMYFRAFYGVPETQTAPDGTPVNAVRGLLDMITRLLRARHPTRLIACMDASWRPAFRVAALPSYKTHRANPDGSEQVPPALNVQLPIIVEVLSATGIAMAWADGYEADDIIGSLAAQASEPVEVVTGDRDLFQVVDDERNIKVAYIGKGVANLEIMDEAAVTAKYHIPGRSYGASSARSRRCWRRSTPATAASPRAAAQSSLWRVRTSTRACRWCLSPRTRPSNSPAVTCRPRRVTRPGSPRSMSGSRSARRSAASSRRSRQRPDVRPEMIEMATASVRAKRGRKPWDTTRRERGSFRPPAFARSRPQQLMQAWTRCCSRPGLTCDT